MSSRLRRIDITRKFHVKRKRKPRSGYTYPGWLAGTVFVVLFVALLFFVITTMGRL